MMIKEIEELLNNYTQWLKDKTILKEISTDWIEITTPHLDRHNDCLQMYVRKEGNNLLLTDDGYIINDLANCGCLLDTPKRQKLLNTTLAGFGVQTDNEKLLIEATTENFSLKKHNMIQAMLAVNDLFYLSSSSVASFFVEDVMNWLDSSEIRYTPSLKLTGKSGYDHMFDFIIPKSKKQPERIVQALSNPNKDSANSLVFKWLDTRETRSDDSQLFAILNDDNTHVPPPVMDALINYKVQTVPWAQREQHKGRLAA